jgi:membrane-bound ClpP family serine protease
MKRKNILFLFLAIFSVQAIHARIWSPKRVHGVNDNAETSESTETTGTESTETNMPVGMPFQYLDGLGGTGSEETNGATQEDPARIVYSFELTEEIGPSSLRQTREALEQARAANAAGVIITIHSLKGDPEIAKLIKAELDAYDRSIVIYVDGKAVSVAALISLSGDNVFMSKGSDSKQTNSTASRAAKENKTDLKQNSNNNSTLTSNHQILNSSQAVVCNLVDAEAATMNEALNRAGMNDCELVYYSPTMTERMIDWCMKPAASLSILALFVGLLHFQKKQKTPGLHSFLLLALLPLLCIPLYQGGRATAAEIGLLISGVLLLFFAAQNKILVRISVVCMLVSAILMQSGDMSHISQLYSLPVLLSAAAFCLGWFVLPFLIRLVTNVGAVLIPAKQHEALSA